jgi:GDPmannose 4,6-dehydratase
MDGSHLADFLLDKGYTVFGVERRSSTRNTRNTLHLTDKITFLTGDLSDQNSLLRCLDQAQPDEVYNLASQSFVGESWNTPEQTSEVTALGVLRVLEAIRMYNKDIKFYQASSSEMFGRMVENPATEHTPFYPRSPYGVSKLYGHWITKNYRESYDMFNCSGILFNHESERRGHEFVTRKITDGVAKIKLGLSDKISLGNLDSSRDWGYAPDYVEAMWLMMQAARPDDYVVATGEAYSIRDFLTEAFKYIGINEWEPYVEQNPEFLRPAEVAVLRGSAAKIREELGWKPKTSFISLVTKMVANDISILE